MKTRFGLVLGAVVVTASLLVWAWLSAGAAKFPDWRCTESKVTRLVFAPNDMVFAVLARHGDEEKPRLLVVDRTSGQTLLHVQSELRIANLAFDESGKYLAAYVDHELVVYDLRSGNAVCRIGYEKIHGRIQSALGFSADGETLFVAPYSVFGFKYDEHDDIAINVLTGKLTGELDKDDAISNAWYGDRLSASGSVWWGGGWPGPTPRVFRRNGDFIGYCFRSPNIGNAWFTTDESKLVTLHTDGVTCLWDLNSVDDTKAASCISTNAAPGLSDAVTITTLHRENTFAFIDSTGRLRFAPMMD